MSPYFSREQHNLLKLLSEEGEVTQQQAPAQAAPQAQAAAQQQAALAAQQAVAQLPPPIPRPRSSFLLIHQWLEQQENVIKKLIAELAQTAEGGSMVRQEYEELGRVVASLRTLLSTIDQTKGFVAMSSRRLDPTNPQF